MHFIDENKPSESLQQQHNDSSSGMFAFLFYLAAVALAIFGVIGDNAIYLHGGRISDEKDDLSLLFCLVNSFYELKKISVKTIDLEGVIFFNKTVILFNF